MCMIVCMYVRMRILGGHKLECITEIRGGIPLGNTT